jgi:hypothetical protein
MTYHLLLSDVIGLTPYNPPIKESLYKSIDHYKIRTKILHVINRSGTFEKVSADLILPLHSRMVQALVQTEALTQISA